MKNETPSKYRSYHPYARPCLEFTLDLTCGSDGTGFDPYNRVINFLIEHKVRYYVELKYTTQLTDCANDVFATVTFQIARGFEEKAVLLKLSI